MAFVRPWDEWALTSLGKRSIGEFVTVDDAATILRCTPDDVRDCGVIVTETEFKGRVREAVRVRDLGVWEVESRARRLGVSGRPRVLELLAGVSVVYFIRGGGLTKIGYSTCVSERMATMQPYSPTPLRLAWVTPGGKVEERALHVEFDLLRRHGEWFSLTLDDMQVISERFPLPPRITKRGQKFATSCHCGRVYETLESFYEHKRFGHRPSLLEQVMGAA